MAKDHDQKVIFDGDIDTPEQRAAIPPPVAERLKTIDQHMEDMGGGPGGGTSVRIIQRPEGARPPAKANTSLRGKMR